MKDFSRLLADALKPITDVGGDDTVPSATNASAIALLTQTIAGRARARFIRRATLAVAAAAMVVGLSTWGLLRRPTSAIEVASAHLALMTRGEASVAAAAGSSLKVGSRIETTSGGSARLRMRTGTQLWLDQQSALEVLSIDQDQHLRLVSGAVRSQVAPLSSKERFRIVTADAEVEVHGTLFVVEWRADPACPGQAATRVRVEEGTVWVRHHQEEFEVRAGSSWPGPCPQAVGATSLPLAARASAPQPPGLGSRLKEENRRFAEVLLAHQQGDTAGALELLDGLRRDFPRGHLQEDFAAEDLRLTAGFDSVRAQRAAKAYLQRFPKGYARALAEELLVPLP